MKKLFGFVVVAVFFLAIFSSCKKDYTCECTYTDMLDAKQTVKMEMEKVKKADAEEACDALKATWTLVDAKTNCELK